MKAFDIRSGVVRLVALICVSSFLSSCIIGYGDFPENRIGDPPKARFNGTLYYRIHDDPIFVTRSKSTLRRIFRHQSGFERSEMVKDIPPKGIYCEVDVRWKALGASAFFGSISYLFYTLIPVWSTKEGYQVAYHVYVDGEKRRTFEYDITRKMAAWIGLLPFIWINWFTYDEDQAFEATTFQFFEDAAPILQKA